MISKETIQELQKIVAEDYGKDITFEEASVIIRDAVKAFDLLAKIDYASKFWSKGEPLIVRSLNEDFIL